MAYESNLSFLVIILVISRMSFLLPNQQRQTTEETEWWDVGMVHWVQHQMHTQLQPSI